MPDRWEAPGRRATDGLDWRPGEEASPPPVTPPPPQPRPRNGSSGALQAALIALGAAVIGGLVTGGLLLAFDGANEDDAAPAATGEPRQAITIEQSDAVAEAAAKARPSVVKIESTRRGANGSTESDVGSGVILDREGHVVTNAHVVLGTETLKVILPDGTERPAILLGHDSPFTDVAVLQVGPGNLTPIVAGDSRRLAPGQTVLAIGNPLGEFEGSVSIGIISGLNRVRTLESVRYDTLIQTDAALNSGNSGGALVDLRGEFIGMPTAILRTTRSGVEVEGLGFAIPSHEVLEVARAIIERGGIPRPELGLEHLDLSPEVLARLPRLAQDEGALVVSVTPGGPAAAAQIRTGDIITQFGDISVAREMPLLNALKAATPGTTVKVVLNRNGAIIETDVRLGTRQ